MELIVYFDHHVLNDLKNEISEISILYNIGLFDFVQVVGRRLRKHWIGKISLSKLKRMLIFIYD